MIALIHRWPSVGYSLASIGGLSALLTAIKVLTPLLGFAGALFGAIAGFITMLSAWEKRKANKKQK